MARSRDEIIEEVVGVKEKGYVNNPSDSGGETNWGVTKNTAKEAKHMWAKYNWDGNMKTLPLDLAYEIYATKYWDAMSLDLVLEHNDLIAEKLFDIGINYSRTRAQEWFQRILNVMNNKEALYSDIVVDSDIGGATERAFAAFLKRRGQEGVEVMWTSLSSFQGVHYLTLSEKREKDEAFTYGWMARRINDDNKNFYKHCRNI